MKRIHEKAQSQGQDSYIFWGRGRKTISDHEVCCGSKAGVYWHGAMCRLFGSVGFNSKRDTQKLLNRLSEINPDVVHLHNIHGYYLNIEMLFEWLASHHCQVKWTLHDCWAFTGHCAHFTFVDCEQWQMHCAKTKKCPQLSVYPGTLAGSSSCSRNYERKKYLFNLLPPERLTLITPSRWLADLVQKSFLAKYPVEVHHNEVDLSIFRPTLGDFREKHDIAGKFIVLGVASPWTDRKGFDDFVRLASDLDETFSVVMVGLSEKQLKKIPNRIIGLKRTESREELAALYTTADVLFNPTKEDNFPTVNLESIACGTPVVSYDVGGCSETLSDYDSCVVENYNKALYAIRQLSAKKVEDLSAGNASPARSIAIGK